MPYFNSIKVQLELPIFPLPLSFPSLFQFHKGTIRTNVAPEVLRLINYFNSIKVQLELRNLTLESLVFVFQFHKGTIRTPHSSSSLIFIAISIP